jgi:NAD+ kinase
MGNTEDIPSRLPEDPRVLVVQKRSFMEMMVGGVDRERFQEFMGQDPVSKERYELAHRENEEAADTVTSILSRRGVRYDVDARPLESIDPSYDLVLSVGGDGTFLSTAHAVDGVPMLGVNSSATFSVGRYCGTHVVDFEVVIAKVLEGSIRPEPLYRIGVEVDGRLLNPPALNEILFAHSLPAGTSRYRIHVGGKSERHKSSGIWVSSAPGSTGAIHSAGGIPLPTSASVLQFKIREAYTEPGAQPQLLRGVQKEGIEVLCLMQDGALFVDGARVVHPIQWGQTLRFRAGHRPLWVYRPSSALFDF